MPDIRFLVNNLGLRGVAIKFLNESQPLEAQNVELPYQAQAGNGSLRLDTGSSETQVYNWLGLPVFCSCRFTDPDNADNKLELLTVIIEVSMTKNIDTVAVNGVDGTIKTYINDGDFDVRLRGMITSSNQDDYPLDDVRKLIELLKIRKSLKVTCEYLMLFGIYELAVMDYGFPQLEGTQNTQLFDISALSDKPIELLEDTL
jgi:hypothetical protein